MALVKAANFTSFVNFVSRYSFPIWKRNDLWYSASWTKVLHLLSSRTIYCVKKGHFNTTLMWTMACVAILTHWTLRFGLSPSPIYNAILWPFPAIHLTECSKAVPGLHRINCRQTNCQWCLNPSYLHWRLCLAQHAPLCPQQVSLMQRAWLEGCTAQTSWSREKCIHLVKRRIWLFQYHCASAENQVW